MKYFISNPYGRSIFLPLQGLHRHPRNRFCRNIWRDNCFELKSSQSLWYQNTNIDTSLKGTIIIKCIFSCDSLTIYDGNSKESLVIGKYCGDSTSDGWNTDLHAPAPPSIQVSSSNEILINFKTNNYNEFNGFKLKYNPYSKNFLCL